MAWQSISKNVFREMDTMQKMHVNEVAGYKLYSAFSPNNYHLGTFEDKHRAILMCELCSQESIEWLKAYVERDLRIGSHSKQLTVN